VSRNDESFGQYGEYSKALRDWFMGFAFGAPVLFVFNEGLLERLLESDQVGWIVWSFAAGAVFQVLLALGHKIFQWCAYRRRVLLEDRRPVGPALAWVANWANEFRLVVAFDLATLVAFAFSASLLRAV
jgi:hypothetical protein